MPPAVHVKQYTALGKQGLRLVPQIGEQLNEITEAAQKAQQEERRRDLRTRVEEASVRPAPGSSDLLGRPLRAESLPGIVPGFFGGLRLRMVESHDLVSGLMPIHLKGGPNE